MGAIEIAAALLGVINVMLVVRRRSGTTLSASPWWRSISSCSGTRSFIPTRSLQIFFLLIQVYGWWAWLRSPQVDHGVAVEWMRWRSGLLLAA
jgi:nicotinamide riboside transporter PnuC